MKNKVPHQIAEVFLKYKPAIELSEALQIKNPKDVYEFFMQVWDMELIEFIEEFKILLLNRANKVLGFYKVSSGGISSALVDPKLIFAAALKAGASGIVLCHNHPSGDVSPSSNDKQLTQRLEQAGNLLEIDIIDHIIISKTGWYSFEAGKKNCHLPK